VVLLTEFLRVSGLGLALLIVGLTDDDMIKISINWGGERGSTAIVERSINLRMLHHVYFRHIHKRKLDYFFSLVRLDLYLYVNKILNRCSFIQNEVAL
jgi:hypothetical protein